MPYATVIPTPERILATMAPVQLYAAYAIAAKLGVGAADIKGMLAKMVEQGSLTKTKQPSKKYPQFMLPGTEAAAPERIGKEKRDAEIDPTTIAAPRTWAVPTGQLSGYEAEIARRQSLCMLARGAR